MQIDADPIAENKSNRNPRVGSATALCRPCPRLRSGIPRIVDFAFACAVLSWVWISWIGSEPADTGTFPGSSLPRVPTDRPSHSSRWIRRPTSSYGHRRFGLRLGSECDRGGSNPWFGEFWFFFRTSTGGLLAVGESHNHGFARQLQGIWCRLLLIYACLYYGWNLCFPIDCGIVSRCAIFFILRWLKKIEQGL